MQGLNRSQQMPSRRIISKKLKTLIQEIQNWDESLNWGGCGAFAYLLAEQLDKYHIPYTFLIWNPSFMNKDQIREQWTPITKYRLKKYYLCGRHVAIKVNRTIYNHINGYPQTIYTYIPRELNYYVKKNICESVGFGRQVWNDSFDISNLWKIRNKLNNKFLSCTEQL